MAAIKFEDKPAVTTLADTDAFVVFKVGPFVVKKITWAALKTLITGFLGNSATRDVDVTGGVPSYEAFLTADSQNRKRTDFQSASSITDLALQGWLTALSNRENAPAKILVVGDSVTEGASATSIDKRYLSRLRDSIRAKSPTSGGVGGVGHLGAYFIGSSMGNPWSSRVGNPSLDDTFGFARRAAAMAAGQSCTYTINCTSFDVYYVNGPSTGTIGISIDGGAAISVDTVGTLEDGKKWNSGPLASGAHIVTVSSLSGTVYFTGIMVYLGDEAKGIQVVESGHFGWKTSNWIANASYWPAMVTTYAPHLICIALGLNDYQSNVPSATLKANLLTMITTLRAATTNTKPSFLLLPLHQRGDVTNPAVPWQDYVNVMYEIAAQDTGGVGGSSGIGLLDMSKRLPAPGIGGAGDPYSLIVGDRVHLSDKGHGLFGETLANFLTPR